MDLGGGFGFGLLLGGLFRLGFVQLGQLVFQLVDLVGCPVQIAAQGGGFFLGLGQFGAELVASSVLVLSSAASVKNALMARAAFGSALMGMTTANGSSLT